jgi:deoxyribonuclease V
VILAVDVHYRGSRAVAAGVLFREWEDSERVAEWTLTIPAVAAYEPGQFYRRELPCILELLKQVEPLPEIIIIDGHVYLDAEGRPGLGRLLYDALQGRCAVIGVAKSRFKDTPPEAVVFRGGSKRALYVTAVGIAESDPRCFILRMHGNHRLPTLLRWTDGLTRTFHGGSSEMLDHHRSSAVDGHMAGCARAGCDRCGGRDGPSDHQLRGRDVSLSQESGWAGGGRVSAAKRTRGLSAAGVALSDAERQAAPGSGDQFVIHTGIQGLPEPKFNG